MCGSQNLPHLNRTVTHEQKLFEFVCVGLFQSCYYCVDQCHYRFVYQNSGCKSTIVYWGMRPFSHSFIMADQLFKRNKIDDYLLGNIY